MKALVCGGGGSKGAFSAGVLQHLLGDLQIQYQTLCGVSVGAITVAFLAQFPHGEEKESILQLTNFWENITNDKVYHKWKPFHKLQGLFKSSFLNSQPLINLINNNISLEKIRKSGKQVNVGAISLNTGKYKIFNQSDDDFIKAVIASASFPGMFKPIEIDNQLWSDGGFKEISPIKKAIDLGADHIDVILTSPQERVKKFIEKPNAIQIINRALDLSTDKIMANDLDKVLIYNKLANLEIEDYRLINLNIIRPQYNLIENLLDFSPQKIQEMMKKGYQDAISNYKI